VFELPVEWGLDLQELRRLVRSAQQVPGRCLRCASDGCAGLAGCLLEGLGPADTMPTDWAVAPPPQHAFDLHRESGGCDMESGAWRAGGCREGSCRGCARR